MQYIVNITPKLSSRSWSVLFYLRYIHAQCASCIRKESVKTTSTRNGKIEVLYRKLDESTARRQLKSPGHYLVDPYTWPWSPNGHGHGHKWSTVTPFVQCQSALPFWDPAISKFDHENPWSRSCVWSKVKVTFDLQNSKVRVMVKVKPIGHIWGPEINRYVCFSFRGNRTTFGWDIGNSIFYLEIQGQTLWSYLRPWSSIDIFGFRFGAIGPVLPEI